MERKPKVKVPSQHVIGGFEKFSYCFYFTGQNIVYFLITSFLTVYFAQTLGISLAVVGIIMLAARIYDAFVDPVLATIIEKSHFKSGKFRPWVRIAAFSVPVITWFCFGFQGFLLAQSMGIRIAYVTVTYLLWGTIYAASDAPAYATCTVMTPVQDERNFLLSFNRLTGLVGILVASAIFPIVNLALGKTINATTVDYNWTLSTGIFLLIALFSMLFIYACKERVSHHERKAPTTAQIFKAIGANKYLLIVLLVMLIANGLNFAMALTPFLASDIFKNPGALSPMEMVMILPMILVAPITPLLIKRFGKIKLMNFSFLSIIVFSVLIAVFARNSLTLFLVLSALKGILSGPFLIAFSILFADCIEYYCNKTGERHEAITFASQTFVSKLVAAFSGGLGVLLVSMFGYKSAVEGQTIVQTSTALNGLWWVTNLAPAVGTLIALVIFMKFYDLTEEKVAGMIKENIEREAAAKATASPETAN